MSVMFCLEYGFGVHSYGKAHDAGGQTTFDKHSIQVYTGARA
jgi:hypothetical protein